jgi:hypothetical protein
MSRWVIAITFVLTTLVALGPGRRAGATTMLPLDLKTMTERADRVVIATVEDEVAAWTADHSAIYTTVTLKVGRSLKGQLRGGDRVQVRREGGSVDGIGMRVHGSAQFAPGEEVLVFLEERGGTTYVVGMAQGKLLLKDDADGRKFVIASHAGIAFTAPLGPRRPPLDGRALEDVEREIRGYVQRGGAR